MSVSLVRGFFLSKEHKKIFYTYSRPMFTDRNIFEDSYQLVKHFSLFSSFVSTELLPLIKSYYLKEAIQYYRKVKSKKCFTNQEESSKLFLSVLPLTSKALEDTAVISPRVLEFIRLKKPSSSGSPCSQSCSGLFGTRVSRITSSLIVVPKTIPES